MNNAGVTFTKEDLNNKLKTIGPKYTKQPFKSRWTEEKPTTGYCYYVSEALFHYSTKQFTSYRMLINEEPHWFLRDESGNIIDATSDQFDEDIDYGTAKSRKFMTGRIKTTRGKISKNGYAIAKLLEMVEESQD